MKVVLQKLALLTVSVLLTLATLDVAYRWLLEPEDVLPREIGRFDDTLGWALVPNAVASSSATGTTVEYRINSKGSRGVERDYAKPPGNFRIVLLGDSYTFGYGV